MSQEMQGANSTLLWSLPARIKGAIAQGPTAAGQDGAAGGGRLATARCRT